MYSLYIGLCWLFVNRAAFIALYILFVTVMIWLLYFCMHVCIMISFLCASTKCHVWVKHDLRNALQLTRADSVCDACVHRCILNFPWTFRNFCTLYAQCTVFHRLSWFLPFYHLPTFDSSRFFTSHLVVPHFRRGSLYCSSLHSWFAVLVFYSADVCLYVCVWLCTAWVSITILWCSVVMRSFFAVASWGLVSFE